MTQTYRINTPGVVHEMIDGEVVIVNLDSGRYYSLDSVGAAVWGMLNEIHDVKTLYSWAQLNYDGGLDSTMKADIAEFWDQLIKDELIVQADDVPGYADDRALPAAGMLTPFAKPQLNTYTDMEELLLLDPIHEVSDEGWPAQE